MKNNNKLVKEYKTNNVNSQKYLEKIRKENKNMKVNLDEALANKLDREFKEFCKGLNKKSKQEIIESAYEITVKEELKEELKNMDLYDAEKEMIIFQDDILTEFYHDWLDCDTPLGESLRDNLQDSVATLTRYMGKRNNKNIDYER